MSTTTFKGARYLVKFHDPIEWASTESYEAIEAVQYQAYTYISKQPVPAGVDISNTAFWLLWADPNAQMEQLRQLVESYGQDIDGLEIAVEGMSTDIGNLQTALSDEETARANADNAIKSLLPDSEFSAESTVKDAIDTANDAISSETANRIESFNELKAAIAGVKMPVFPYLVGIDSCEGSANGTPQYSAVVEHEGLYYGLFPKNDGTGNGIPVIYTASNKAINKLSANNHIGHGNSMCYDDRNDKIYTANETSINIFDANFAYESSVTISHTAYSISFDSQNSKLYIMEKVSDSACNIIELDEQFADLESVAIDISLFNNGTLQDMAVNDGEIYVSTAYGLVAVYDIETGNMESTFNIMGIDAGFTRRLGEIEGMEFNNKNVLFCASTINFSPYGCVGFTLQLTALDKVPVYHWMNQTRTITFNGNNINKWHNEANIVSSLLELNSLISDTVSQVECYNTIPIQTYQQTPITKSCELLVKSGCTLNSNRLVPSCPMFVIQNEGTIAFTAPSVSAINCSVYNLTQVTINNRGTITHDSSSTHPLITLGYNKQPFVVGNNNGSAVTIDRYNNPAAANSIWLGGNYHIYSNA